MALIKSTHLRFDVPVDDSAAMAVGKGRQKLVHVELRSSGNDMFDIAHCHDKWAPGFPSRDEEKSGGATIIIPSGLRCPLSCNSFQCSTTSAPHFKNSICCDQSLSDLACMPSMREMQTIMIACECVPTHLDKLWI